MKNKKTLIPILITAVFILITGILYKQPFLQILPLFVSLFVMTLQANINPVGYLLGACNSILYCFVFLYFGLYASLFNALFISFPMQLFTFFHWKKRTVENKVVMRELSWPFRIIVALITVIACVVTIITLSKTDSQFVLLDSISNVLGILIPILTMLAYVEYAYLWPIHSLLALFLNIQVMTTDITYITYVIYGIFSLYCVIRGTYNVLIPFHKQKQAEKKRMEKPGL